MQVRSHGQVVQQSYSGSGKRIRPIEAHRLVSAKPCSTRQRPSQVSLDVRKDHLRSKGTRGDMVGPPQTIDVASQTFAPVSLKREPRGRSGLPHRNGLEDDHRTEGGSIDLVGVASRRLQPGLGGPVDPGLA
jgi:hypothetical protein